MKKLTKKDKGTINAIYGMMVDQVFNQVFKIPKTLKPYSGKSVPVYCYRCQKKLVLEKKHSNYNSTTGEEEFRYILKCQVFLPELRGHLVDEFDNEGNEIIHWY